MTLIRSLTLRYVLALTLVGCLATTAFLFLHKVIQRHENEAAVVNIAGRQRMLSQRVTLAASHMALTDDARERRRWRDELVFALDLMGRSHRALTLGGDDLGIPAELAATVGAMYAARPLDVSGQITRFIADGRRLASAGEAVGPDSPAYRAILDQSPGLLSGLDEVVRRYQSEVERRVLVLERLEMAVWLTTLAVLVMEAGLIFRPMVRRVQHSLAGEEARRAVAERQAASDQRKAGALIDTIADAVIIVDENGIIQTFSPSAETMFGWSRTEMLGNSIGVLMPESVRHRHGEILRRFLDTGFSRKGGLGLEVEALCRDGTLLPVELALGEWREGDRRFLTAVIRDIARRKALEHSVRRAQKMEAVGQLSGGVAHDFNNLLGIISGNLEILADGVAGDERMRRRVEIARHAVARGADLTRKLLSFSGNHASQPETLDINVLIRSSSDLLERLETDRVAVSLKLGENLPPVHIDPGAFEDVLLNLALNARDAMPEGGTLTIETSGSERGEGRHFVAVRVTDTGIGIPPEMLRTIFEPFFTTKAPGKGTGLGLATVDVFLKRSGGEVHVYSEAGRGTTFCIEIPAADAVEAPRPPWEEAEIRGGTESLLIVDDEADLREIVRSQLESLGYRCREAEDGATALEILAVDPAIRLLATDIIMPGRFDGVELARRARAARPDLKILLLSGYAGRSLEQTSTEIPGAGLILKPFCRGELALGVRALLDGDGALPAA